MNWVVTIPKTIKWSDYEAELTAVADGRSVLNYRTRYFPRHMMVGHRLFVVHDGQVKGWMRIVGMTEKPELWLCETTGTWWGAGKYIQRSGAFHTVQGVAMKGFRGIREYKGDA